MKIGILTPMEEEIRLLHETIDHAIEHNEKGFEAFEGKYAGHDLVVVRCGIGKVAAAIGATILIDRFGVEAIINNGSAGSLSSKLHIGDVVLSDKFAYNDADATQFGYPYGQIPAQDSLYFEADSKLLEVVKSVNPNAHTGLIVSGDSFIGTNVQKEFITGHFPDALCTEMEGAAVAQVAKQFGIPFVAVRGISDEADDSASVNFDEYVVEAGRVSAATTLKLIEKLA
ncbi:MAG: 5'-methylthioadenosine/adenosylhomocysteine nucleosidase [Lactobacillales bacterium]|jgi:adenosylhomocysteine nucleosidase|nr:5'-methylthioadenosine/adenosylhomocysteine nucleosidase [Lactobacillales bacterium]